MPRTHSRPPVAPRRCQPAIIESLQPRTLFAGGTIPVTVTLNSSDIYPTAGAFVLTAAVAPQTTSITPTGNVAFFDGLTPIGSSAVGADGTANIKPTLNGIGSQSITAIYSGDSNYAGATAAAIVENLSSNAALTPSLKGALPSTIVAGQKTHVHQVLTVALSPGLSFNGPVTGQLFLVTGAHIDSASVQLPQTLSKRLKLKGGQHTTLPINLTTLPAGTPTGNYHLLLKLSDASGAIVTAETAAVTGVEAPVHDIGGAFVKVPAKASAGKKFSATIAVTNTGNLPIRGALQLSVEASANGSVDANLLPVPKRNISIQPGKTVRLNINGFVASTAGAYYLIAEIDPANTLGESTLSNNTFISTTLVSVAG